MKKSSDVPEILNTITDVVLAYRPKPKSKAARKRKRLKSNLEKEMSPPDGGFSIWRYYGKSVCCIRMWYGVQVP